MGYLLIVLCMVLCCESVSVRFIPESGTPPPAREYPGFTLDTEGNNLYIYGGSSDIKYSDMWKFDLISQRWTQIYPASVLTPGPRSYSFMTALKDQFKLVLFGGIIATGPVSDVWIFDIYSESVIANQWKLIDDIGKPPPRAYHRSVCEYVKDGKQYIAVYGGISRSEYQYSLYMYCLYRLDLQTFTWSELITTGNLPEPGRQSMKFYEDSIYLWGTYNLYKLDLSTGIWTKIELPSSKANTYSNALCIYDHHLYAILGVDPITNTLLNTIYKVNIQDSKYDLQEFRILGNESPESSFGYYCKENIIYMFGGATRYGPSNSLGTLNIDNISLQYNKMSKHMAAPTPRRGHAMEVYDDKLYIFGGVDNSGNSLIDIWVWDLNTEIYSPISIHSTLIPSPRSEVAHTKLEYNFIVFGGIGNDGLLNDLYIFNLSLKAWEQIIIESQSKPSPRRAACLAASSELIFIFGGIEADGYSDQLWMFDWSDRSYTLLNSMGGPPKSAFSQCHTYSNSLGEVIFKVYMGETEGQLAASFVYEYNLAKHEWDVILDVTYDFRYYASKSAVFMINDKVITAGGSSVNESSYSNIILLDINTGQKTTIGNLPQETFYAASAFYKNKIYIHGGSYSFGWLALREVKTNDLIVIELNENCDDASSICIPDCSKGTYYRDGVCHLCPKGSYSEDIGSDSCNLCPKGYVSDVRGADSAKTCKPCPYGYFSLEEGQMRCNDCPNDKECSFDKISDYSIVSESYTSIQPELMEYEEDTIEFWTLHFDIILSIVFLISVILLLRFSSKFIRKVDIYTLRHNYKVDKPMYIRTTLIGGLFTIGFIFAVLSVVFKMSLSYGLDNVIETKASVPLVALQHKYKEVILI